MISGQDGLHRLRTRTPGVWVVAFWLSSAWPALAHAQWRLLLAQPDDAELVTRVEGQTRDLGVQVEVFAGTWHNEKDAASLAGARRADFVARVERARDGALEVNVYGARSRSLRTRSVPRARGERLGGSAELETAALVLRGELSALMHAEHETTTGAAGGGGSSTGGAGAGAVGAASAEYVHTDAHAQAEERTSEPKHEQVQLPATEEPEPEPDLPLANYSAHRSAWTLLAAARGSLPIDDQPAFGLQVGARIPLAWLELGLSFSGALPFEVHDQLVRIRLQRYALGAEAHGVLPWGPRLRVLLGVQAGLALYVRETELIAVEYKPAGDEPAWTPSFGAHAALQWLLARQWGLELGAGLDVIPLRTAFAYTTRDPRINTEIAVLRTFEPSATLGVFGLFGD